MNIVKIMLIYMNIKIMYKRRFKGVLLLFYTLYSKINYPGLAHTLQPNVELTGSKNLSQNQMTR